MKPASNSIFGKVELCWPFAYHIADIEAADLMLPDSPEHAATLLQEAGAIILDLSEHIKDLRRGIEAVATALEASVVRAHKEILDDATTPGQAAEIFLDAQWDEDTAAKLRAAVKSGMP